MKSGFDIVALLWPGPFAEQVKAYFREIGWKIRLTHQAEEALRSLGESKPDLVLMDAESPRFAQRLVERLIQLPEGRSLPVFFITGALRRPPETFTRPLACTTFLDRPFGLQTLRENIEHFAAPNIQKAAPAWCRVDCGTVSSGSVADLLESVGHTEDRYLIRFLGHGMDGEIRIAEGAVTEVRCGPMDGHAAMDALLRMDAGIYEIYRCGDPDGEWLPDAEIVGF